MADKFTFEYYRELLRSLISNGYQFIFFDEMDQNQNEKFVLLRHDIDFDIDKSLQIAEIEKEFGVNSTYFFLISSEFYNIHHIDNIKKISRLLELGNKISIHFDTSNYPGSSEDEIQRYVNKDISYFRSLFNIDINIVSFHRPDSNILMGKLNLNIDNTYMEKYSKAIKYLSDSMKRMPEGDLIEIISSGLHPQIQLLLHPIWWGDIYREPQEDYEVFLNKKLENLKWHLSQNSRIYTMESK